MQVSFGSFIPTRVTLSNNTTFDRSAEDEVVELFCEDMRDGKNSQNTLSIQKQRQQFANSVPSYREQSRKIGMVIAKDKDGSQTRYVLTGGDAIYCDDMGSLYNRRSKPWKFINYEGATATKPPTVEEQARLEGKSKVARQESLSAMVREHAFNKELIIHAQVLNPKGNTKRERYEIQDIEFVDNKTPGLDFKA